MKEKIGRLSKGIFDYSLPELLTSEDTIDLTVETGRTCHGSFSVFNSDGKMMKGLLYSSSRLFILEEDKYLGSEQEIHYHFNAEYLDAGTDIKGNISIVSDCGEKKIPFYVKVSPPVCITSVGEVKDLFQFTNLAKENIEEARKLFVSDDFRRILKYYNNKLLLIYDALVKNKNSDLAMEEFLISTHKKNKINCIADRYIAVYDTGAYNFVDKIKLTKDTWGYVEFNISADSDFIEPEKYKITSDDFINNSCDVSFVINAEKMKTGVHYGKLIIESIHQCIEIEVTCRCIKAKAMKSDRKKRILINRLTDNYLKFRSNQISSAVYVKDAEKDIASLHMLRKDNVLDQLYRIHLLYVAGKGGVARSLLAELNISKEKNSMIEYSAYLYLKTLLKQFLGIPEITEEIRSIYKSEENHWLLFFILLYLDKRYDSDVNKKYEDIKEYVLKGCNSPVIYYEAANLLINEPALLKELGIFEQKILCFMIKYGLYDKNIASNLHYHSLKIKYYNPILFTILCRYYEKYQLKELLTAIVTLLIRGHKTEKKYFWWYRLAMQEQLKIAELPEYYLNTAENMGITNLDSALYTYFQNSKGIDTRNKSYLYYTLLLKNDSAFIYSYKDVMLKYAAEQLQNKRISKELSLIYKENLTDEEIIKAYAEMLPYIIFKHEITCFNPKIKKILVIHKELKSEEIYLLKDNRVLADIFSEEAEIFFIDESDNRYCKTIEYSVERLFNYENYARLCYDAGCNEEKLIIYLNERSSYDHNKVKEAIVIKERMAGIENLNEEYRRLCRKELIYYYYDNFEGDLLEKNLLLVDYYNISKKDRNRFIEYMIIRDMYNEALQALEKFGYEDIDLKRIKKLCTHILNYYDEKPEKPDIITELCFLIFKSEKYNKEQLSYLSDFYYGTTDELYCIWKAAEEYELDTTGIEERLLVQMLFTESYVDNSYNVFVGYYKKVKNKKLIRAFISFYSYKYLVFGRIIKQELFEIIKNEITYEENEICLIALLKHLSEKERLTDDEILFVDYHINELDKKGIGLPFFKLFSKHMRIPLHMMDKYYVEYHTDSSYKVKIRFSNDLETGFKEDNMKNVCFGIYVYEFVLFIGETLQYYIIEECNGQENITESIKIHLEPDSNYGEATLYNRMNQIFAAKELMDESTMLNDLYDYLKLQYGIKKLFKPV